MPPDPSAPPVPTRALRVFGITAIVVVIVVVVAGLVMRAFDNRQLRNWTDERAIPIVSVLKPGIASNAASLDLPGRLQAYSRALLYARVTGYLKSWKADIGTRVKAGQLIAEIDTPDLDQELLQAKADLASSQATAQLAKTTAERWQLLLNSGYVSPQAAGEKTGDFSTKQALVNAAQANVDRLQALKAYSRIVAPFDGLVTARLTDIGALVNGGSGLGQELFEVSNTRMLRVYVNVPQIYVPNAPPGTKVVISVPEHPEKTYAATVAESSQAVNTVSGTTLVQIHVDNADAELMPGAFANVNFELPASKALLSIPASALMFDKAGLRVATVTADNIVMLKPVTIARDLGKVIELGSGLSPEDLVIESPPDGIASGDKVRIAPTTNASGGRDGTPDKGPSAY
jgi:membrane fusion protein (multidrug efflux system)